MVSFYLGFGVLSILLAESAGLYCLSCANAVSPRHCHTVMKCSEGEVCFTEKHTTGNGLEVFNTGCGNPQTCHIRQEEGSKRQYELDSQCIECCSSDICNNAGCGETGYPLVRGPVCFNCQQVSNPELCDTIKVCDPNQECHIHQEEEFGDIYYTTKCINKHACTSNIAVFGKRNTDHCSSCCQLDLCNTECGNAPYGSTPNSTVGASTNNNVHVPISNHTREPMTQFVTVTSTIESMQSSYPTESIRIPSLGNRGTEFLLLFMANTFAARGPLITYITTSNFSSVEIESSPSLNQTMKSKIDRNFNFSDSTNISFPFDVALHDFIVEDKALILRTTDLAMVTLFDSNYDGSIDGTLVIPLDKLATSYIVSTSDPWGTGPEFKSQFALGVLYDNTKINIRFNIKNNESIILYGKSYISGDVFSITMDRLQTFQVSHFRDLTGTYITSNKPIAVFSGNKCGKFLTNTLCSHMVSQMPPTNEYDIEYIIPHFPSNDRTLIQVVSPVQNILNIRIRQNTSTWHLDPYDPKYINTSELIFLKSDYPILVTGYAEGSNSYDPYMTVIPGVHQYLNYYKIFVPNLESITAYISFIVPTDSSLYIDGKYFTGLSSYGSTVKSSEKTYYAYSTSVSKGVSVIETSNHKPFGLFVLGHRQNDGFGYAGNFVFP